MSSTTLTGAAGNASGAASSANPSTQRGYVPARAVGSYVPKLTRKAFEKYGFSAATLLTDWANIVGEETAAYTAPERLKWPRPASSGAEDGEGDGGQRQGERHQGAVLVLRVDPARALDAEYKGRQIVERINGYFGYRAISELRLLQAPLRGARDPAGSRSAPPAGPPPPCAAPELADIADERLRAALTRLKSGLLARAHAGS
jgi:hypothetical protein